MKNTVTISVQEYDELRKIKESQRLIRVQQTTMGCTYHISSSDFKSENEVIEELIKESVKVRHGLEEIISVLRERQEVIGRLLGKINTDLSEITFKSKRTKRIISYIYKTINELNESSGDI